MKDHSPDKGVDTSGASVYSEAPVRDLMGEQGEVISRVARTGKSCTTGDHEGDKVPQSSPTPSLPTQLPPTLQIVNMFTQLPPNMNRLGACATGDPDEVPSMSTGAHEAPPWQDKQASTSTLALAPEVGNCALRCLASLGRPPEHTVDMLGDDWDTTKAFKGSEESCEPPGAALPNSQRPPTTMNVFGACASGDPAEVPSQSPGVPTTPTDVLSVEVPSTSTGAHEAPPWQDKQAFASTLALAHEGGGCALHRLASPGRPTSDDDVTGDVLGFAGASLLYVAGHSLAQIEHSVGQQADGDCLAAIFTAWNTFVNRPGAGATGDPDEIPMKSQA